jgi:UDP-N-acetylglucosamine--N-acetylmuramyl-(pentapeptide) pyrophosphoryl-undecaprenol N-acetylglucosamine transferase
VVIDLARAYFAPYGVGLGHASRLVTIASRLNGYNASIEFSTYGEAASYIQMHGFNCNIVPAVELVWSGESGFSIKNSLGNIPSWFTNFFRQVNDEIRNLVSFDPDVVVSDSRLSPVLSARMLGIPSIVILNQVKLLLSPRLRELTIARIFEKMNGEFLGGLWNMSDRVLIPDLPPPYTISEHNIWDCDSIRKKVEYVGFTTSTHDPTPQGLNDIVKTLGIDRARHLVFVHISGPSSTRLSLISRILEAVRDPGHEIQYIISEGRPYGKTEPTKVSKSVWYYEWCPVKDEIYSLCDLILMRGGHTAISQAIQYGKPIVTIPIKNQGEQLGNAAKVSKMGIGIKLDPSNIRAGDIVGAIHEVLNNDCYLQNIKKVKGVAEDMDGIENVINIIRSYF